MSASVTSAVFGIKASNFLILSNKSAVVLLASVLLYFWSISFCSSSIILIASPLKELFATGVVFPTVLKVKRSLISLQFYFTCASSASNRYFTPSNSSSL